LFCCINFYSSVSIVYWKYQCNLTVCILCNCLCKLITRILWLFVSNLLLVCTTSSSSCISYSELVAFEVLEMRVLIISVNTFCSHRKIMLLLWLALYMQSVIDVLLIRNQTNLVLQYFVISFVYVFLPVTFCCFYLTYLNLIIFWVAFCSHGIFMFAFCFNFFSGG